jgi:hypothetical protein
MICAIFIVSFFALLVTSFSIQSGGLNLRRPCIQGSPYADAAARSIRNRGIDLGVVLAGLVNLLNPEVIVIADGVLAAWKIFSVLMLEQVEKGRFNGPPNVLRLCAANWAMTQASWAQLNRLSHTPVRVLHKPIFPD